MYLVSRAADALPRHPQFHPGDPALFDVGGGRHASASAHLVWPVAHLANVPLAHLHVRLRVHCVETRPRCARLSLQEKSTPGYNGLKIASSLFHSFIYHLNTTEFTLDQESWF